MLNMVFKLSAPKVMFMWTIIFVCVAFTDIIAATSESPAIRLEEEALLNSGWWNGKIGNNNSDHCKWTGITCNQAGSITWISLDGIGIEGELKQFNFSCFKNLEHFSIFSNNISGSIPSQVGGLSKLNFLDLSNNNLTGAIPPEIGNLRNLNTLSLGANNLTGPIPSTLGHLTKLNTLSIFSNQLSGWRLQELGNLMNLTVLFLDGNNLTGSIPSTLGRLTKLEYLFLQSNQLGVRLPQELGNLMNLRYLSASYNNLIGPVPSTLGHLSNLTSLYLDSNQLNGSIPPKIGSLRNLLTLNLSTNHLSGQIPSTVERLVNLTYLDLSGNNLSGLIPFELMNCSHLKNLTLSNNKISGSIPLGIVNLNSTLVSLDLSNNSVSGTILYQLGDVLFLRYLNLSHNKLSGTVPESLTMISALDLSYNNLEGKIPIILQCKFPKEIFIGNNDLHSLSSCSGRPSNSNLKIEVIHFLEVFLPASIFLIFFVLWVLNFLKFKKSRVEPETMSAKSGDVFSIWNYDGRIAYEDIIKATEDFNIKFCIGIGGYGSVYRVKLPNGKVFALKKLHSWECEQPIFMESFQNEIRVLSEVRHRNIVQLNGFCLHNKNMFLIYEYIERGSLFCVLHNDDEAIELDWAKRVNVIKGVAHALCYLHHSCTPSIVHRDISSNNILLNSTFEAFVADFGTAKLLHSGSTSCTILAGTYGYIAPGNIHLLHQK